MSKADNGTEYVFIDDAGKEHYEIVFERKEVFSFQKMHKAHMAMPLKNWETTKTRLTECSYLAGDQPFQCPRCGVRTEQVTPTRERCPKDGLEFTVGE